MSILLSNLLENALQACIKEQKKGYNNLEISLKIQHNGQQCVISITNPCSTPINLDEEGLPRATREGHGIGMVSLKMFLEKYHGYATFTQNNNQVSMFLYWRNDISCSNTTLRKWRVIQLPRGATGNLGRGVKMDVNVRQRYVSGVVSSKAPHGHLVEFGTEPRYWYKTIAHPKGPVAKVTNTTLRKWRVIQQ